MSKLGLSFSGDHFEDHVFGGAADGHGAVFVLVVYGGIVVVVVPAEILGQTKVRK